jgi:hypothetical protein
VKEGGTGLESKIEEESKRKRKCVGTSANEAFRVSIG